MKFLFYRKIDKNKVTTVFVKYRRIYNTRKLELKIEHNIMK